MKLNQTIAGIDEVGRGAWAGPVYAAAVILNTDHNIVGIKDSKKLSKARREVLSEQIKANSIFAFGKASVEEIDKLNIRQATLLAMKRAVEALSIIPSLVLVDGIDVPAVDIECKNIINGDNLDINIAAASIIAKVKRDNLMQELAQLHPLYGWDKNVGYGTKEHMMAIENHGIVEHHRRSFKPIANNKIICNVLRIIVMIRN